MMLAWIVDHLREVAGFDLGDSARIFTSSETESAFGLSGRGDSSPETLNANAQAAGNATLI